LGSKPRQLFCCSGNYHCKFYEFPSRSFHRCPFRVLASACLSSKAGAEVHLQAHFFFAHISQRLWAVVSRTIVTPWLGRTPYSFGPFRCGALAGGGVSRSEVCWPNKNPCLPTRINSSAMANFALRRSNSLMTSFSLTGSISGCFHSLAQWL
jgi:hypothetical protein